MMAASSAWIRSSASQSPHSGINTGKRRVRRVLIVDDHPIVRHGLCRIMENEDDLVVCGEAETARDARTVFFGKLNQVYAVPGSAADKTAAPKGAAGFIID